MARRALISVSDKEGLVEFARELVSLEFELVSTGGTAKVLKEAGLPVIDVESVTAFSEILAGRVKTLHPKIHGAILAKLEEPDHLRTLHTHAIEPIELVCVNLYPFETAISRPGCSLEEAIENIDIGGPAMIRSAAKNHEYVTVVVEPQDYGVVVEELKRGGVTSRRRRTLAAKAFRHTAAYDALIARYFTELTGEEFPERITLTYAKEQDLRYGENPQQRAAFYRAPLAPVNSLVQAEQLHGKALSYNNINDANAALALAAEFSQPAAVAVKHMNPCGAGVGTTAEEAFTRAFASDPVSIFGGIVAFNRPVDAVTAKRLHQVFLEIIIAPAFSADALEILREKKNLRLLTLDLAGQRESTPHYVSLPGGMLVQTEDSGKFDLAVLRTVTKREPTEKELEALEFGWKVCKHVRSNAIVVSGREMTFGIGAGQMNRVGAAEIALRQAKANAKGAVLASDAFFPMPDTVELAGKAGITAIIQPGGSIRDQDSIEMADRFGIAMVFTGMRHFKH
ncbi:MAG: bifunctional phosphoribosylaminoimidazolecarboxamide formyltransferase/IMP cyclohydrolase [Firmicutes bacterium]|nr:bifunctional phosphoribosylaminoimidazolecarboxamide formyltransferase/IMP cyclohydrolase [Bacillota bacterium]